MVYVTTRSDVRQTTLDPKWRMKAYILSGSAAAAGLTMGAVLGALGSGLRGDGRSALATLAGVVAILIGGIGLLRRVLPPLQCDRETPRGWSRYGAIGYSALNGIAIGTGITTRIGFWLWYVIPISALLSGNALLGALLFGTYALVRGLGVWAYVAINRLSGIPFDRLGEAVVGQKTRVDMISMAQLVIIGLATTVSLGV